MKPSQPNLRGRRAGVAAAAAAWSLALAASAAAQAPVQLQEGAATPPAADAASSDAAGAEYERVIAAALERYAARDWAGARADFERAHAMRPGARTLRGLGLCAYYAGDYASAASSFEQALADARHPLSPEQRAQVSDLLARSFQHVGQVRVQVRPAEAAIRIGERAVANQARVLLAPGAYALEVSHPGHETHARSLDVAAGQDSNLYVELAASPGAVTTAPLVASPAAPAPRAPERATPPPAAEHTDSASSPAPWIAGGLTLAAGVSAAVFALLTADERSDLQERCDRAGCDDPTRRVLWRDSPIETYETAVNVSLIAAAAGAVTTVTLLLLQPSAPHGTARPAPSVDGSRGGLRVSLSF
jgi:tetratricopeptide (TPR) repeat protein